MSKPRLPSSVIKVYFPFFFGNLGNSLSSLLFPWNCPGCNILLKYPDVICVNCESSLPKICEPFCKRCGTAFPQHWKVSICPECHQRKHRITATRSAYEYEGLAAQMIKEAKYLRKGRYLRYFADHLFVLARTEFPSIKAVVPVPLHKSREWIRTFNQAEILATRIAKLWDLPVWYALNKVSRTKPQSSLSGSTRRSNLQNVFKFRHTRHNAKSVLLVDDVITTGSTLNECARVLRRNGVKRVYAVTIARADLK